MESILFLEDIGVAEDYLQHLVRNIGLREGSIVDEEQARATPEQVIAIVTIRGPVGDPLLGQNAGDRTGRRFPNLRVVSVAFTGFDCVDLDACRRRDIAVCNVPAYSTDSVAELTLGLAIALLREIPRADRQIRTRQESRSGWWNRFGPGAELAGKTVGIIGTGTIGLRVAALFHAFGCKLVGWSRTEREEFKSLPGIYLPAAGDVFGAADIVSIHLPLNPETEGIVGANELGRMPEGACLINAARGPIIQKDALLGALQEKQIRAALDVYHDEPLSADDPLQAYQDRTILTPHIGYKTREALDRRARIAIENIQAALAGREQNRVA